jgi:predicted glutamine amidotransferase
MFATIATINKFHEDDGITEVGVGEGPIAFDIRSSSHFLQPSLMNFCITDGESVVATRYISSRKDAAASLVRMSMLMLGCYQTLTGPPQWFSSGTSFSEYAPGGHYKMFKEDKRQNVIMVASEPLTFEKGDT